MKINEIIEELNLENGSKYKLGVLENHKDNELLQKVLKMTYDKVDYSYGISLKNVSYTTRPIDHLTLKLEDVLDNLLASDLAERKLTGHAAINTLNETLSLLSAEDAEVVCKIINRDLKINMGRSQINKVIPNLITKPIYQRCDVYSKDAIDEKGKVKKGTERNIDMSEGAILQLKADGTYREFSKIDGNVDVVSRSGEPYSYPLLEEQIMNLKDGAFNGELTVKADFELIQKIYSKLIKLDQKNETNDAYKIVEMYLRKGDFILPRAIGNGLINSDEVPHENLVLDLWDYITPEEYKNAANKIENKIKYEDRFKDLTEQLSELKPGSQIQPIETVYVKSIQEALVQTSKWMNEGLEGGILKDKNAVFRDGTSKQQLKLKVEFSVEVRITGFLEGKKGTKRENTFGSILFETDDGKIKGRTSGFSEKQLEDFNSRRSELIGQVMQLSANDITKSSKNNYYALSHPRFDELRTDKTTTDTFERAMDSLNSAKCLSEQLDIEVIEEEEVPMATVLEFIKNNLDNNLNIEEKISEIVAEQELNCNAIEFEF